MAGEKLCRNCSLQRMNWLFGGKKISKNVQRERNVVDLLCTCISKLIVCFLDDVRRGGNACIYCHSDSGSLRRRLWVMSLGCCPDLSSANHRARSINQITDQRAHSRQPQGAITFRVAFSLISFLLPWWLQNFCCRRQFTHITHTQWCLSGKKGANWNYAHWIGLMGFFMLINGK